MGEVADGVDSEVAVGVWERVEGIDRDAAVSFVEDARGRMSSGESLNADHGRVVKQLETDTKDTAVVAWARILPVGLRETAPARRDATDDEIDDEWRVQRLVRQGGVDRAERGRRVTGRVEVDRRERYGRRRRTRHRSPPGCRDEDDRHRGEQTTREQ